MTAAEHYVPPSSQSRWPGVAWVSLCLAVALHVWDEAVTGFLDVYNPAVLALKRHVPWLPLPTFEFAVWITGLALAVLLALSLSPYVFRKARWARAMVVVVGGVMILNGLGHLTGSMVMGSVMPGAYSSPILIVAAAGALLTAWRYWSESGRCAH